LVKKLGYLFLKKLVKKIATLSLGLTLILYSCNKKYIPHQNNVPVITVPGTGNSNNSVAKPLAVTKPVSKTIFRKTVVPVTVPKVIWVDDKAAKKNFDGRLYYDVDGRRYWKNYNDGKYYLFNQAMYSDSAFKPH
jgi:hypothetical protein